MKVLKSKFGEKGWHPDNARDLETVFECENISKTRANAVICPHAGYRFCGETIRKIFTTFSGAHLKNVIIISPSHYSNINNMIIGCEFDAIETPLGVVNLYQEHDFIRMDGAHVIEHGIQMIIPAIQHYLPNVTVLPLVIGSGDNNFYQETVSRVAAHVDDETLLIASSDFTHYGSKFNYTPISVDTITRKHIEMIDQPVLDIIEQHDLDKYINYMTTTKNTICGRDAIRVLLSICTGKGQIVDYRMSGDTINDYTTSVSYAGVVFS